MTAAHFLVSGRVQGVAFRVHTRAQAIALGLSGYAYNLADGRVDVLAIGDAEAIERLAVWLRDGPPLARVDAVTRMAVTEDVACDGFLIG